MQTLIIHGVCFNQPSHQPRCWEQPTTIITISSILVLSRLEEPGAQLPALHKCPGCAPQGWQDHSGLQAASRYQPPGLGFLLYMGLFLYVYLAPLCLHISARVCFGAFFPLLWGIFLPCGTGLVTTLNGEDIETAAGKESKRREEERKPHKDERKRVGGLCECMCACTPWVFTIKARGKK